MASKPPDSPDRPNNCSNPSHDVENTLPKDQTWRTNNALSECKSATLVRSPKIRPTPSPLKNFDVPRNPRRISSPEKRFPVKPYTPPIQPPPTQTQSIEDVLRDNEGLTKVMQILESKDSDIDDDDEKFSDDTLASIGATLVVDDDSSNVDDTICSTFSSFSAAPDSAILSKFRQTHNPKGSENSFTSPRSQTHPSSNRNSSIYSKSEKSKDDDTTTMLLEFTEDLNKYGDKHSNPKFTRYSAIQESKSADLNSTPMTKRNTISNLLDFDIPPAPTPRSLPSITPRELESLKSNFLYEISSLKASLSGKEAEVLSLKSAVGDAEKRVGDSMEQLREEQNQKQQIAQNLEEWEKRAKELEVMIMKLQEESDELAGRLSESDARRQAAELMAQEAESRMAALKLGRTSPEIEVKVQPISDTNSVDQTVENVCKDLHALYKGKHEAKITALKKSYERRWDKRVNDLEKQVEDLMKENTALKSDLDSKSAEVKFAQNSPKIKDLEARLEDLSLMYDGINYENNELRQFLEVERVEKGKLVQTVEEMIPLITSFDDLLANMDRPSSASPRIHKSHHSLGQESSVEKFRGSLARVSSTRAPTSHTSAGESRIGKGGFGLPTATKETKSRCNSAIARPTNGLEFKSGIMNSIQRMGSHKGRGKC